MILAGKVVLTVASLTLAAGAVLAQPVISAKSGMVSRVEGDVFIGDTAIENSQTNFPEVKENAVLRTQEGRAEVLLTRGVYMRIGEKSSFKMLTNRLIDTRLELLSGSTIVEADEILKDNNLTILAGEATVAFTKHGLYRFDLESNHIKVFDGTLSVEVKGKTLLVGAGRMVRFEGGEPVIDKFNKDDMDALDTWSKRRAEQIARANPSSAKELYDAGCAPARGRVTSTNWATTSSSRNCQDPCNSWRYNPWYGLITYIPCGNDIYSPYGYRYWAPVNVMQAYYVPRPPAIMPASNAGFGNHFPSMGNTSGGYSGAMSSSTVSSQPSAPAAAATTGTTAVSSAGTSSAGHGSGGGHGK